MTVSKAGPETTERSAGSQGRIVVTGASGFIGTHLCNALHSTGMDCLPLVHEEGATALQEKNALQLVPDLRSRAISVDITSADTLVGIFQRGDRVLHLAAIARDQDNRTEADYKAVNVEGTRNLLKAAGKAGARRLLMTSTIEAGGPAREGKPLTESQPARPINRYGRSKLEAERLVLEKPPPGMETTVVRLPLIYGPGNFLNVPKLFGAVRTGLYPIFGNGRNKMEFCFVQNAIHGLLLALDRPEASGELFYISEGSITLGELLQALAKGVGSRPIFLRIPVPVGLAASVLCEGLSRVYPRKPFVNEFTGKPFITRNTIRVASESRNICSYEKARKLLGYEPQFSLEQGIAITVQDFRRRGWIRA